MSRVLHGGVKLIGQGNTGALAGMSVGVYGDCDAGMPQLLGHVLDGGMILIELDRRVAMAEIVDAVPLQPSEGTDTPVELIEPARGQWAALGATEHHGGNGRGAMEHGRIKALVPEFQERSPELLGHINTATFAVLWGVKRVVHGIIGPLDMQKPVRVVGVLPDLNILPLQPQRFPFAHAGPGEAEEIGIVLRIGLTHSRQVAREFGIRKRGNRSRWCTPLFRQIPPELGGGVAVKHFLINGVLTDRMEGAYQVSDVLWRVALMLLRHKRFDLGARNTPEILDPKRRQEMIAHDATEDAPTRRLARDRNIVC